MRGFTWVEIGVVAGIILCLLGIFIGSAKSNKAWADFKEAHNCKLVSKSEGSVGVGVGPSFGGSGSGVAVVVVPQSGKEGWLCDDGVTYWRNK